MVTTAALAGTAALVGDPARAAMLGALMDGRALTAGELARAAGVEPQTASGHLARLSGAGLLAVERQGRHRYHRLASPAVARMLEGIMAVAGGGPPPARPVRVGPRDAALRAARTCYDHLAGRLAVDLADAMAARGHLLLDEGEDGGGELTTEGAAHLRTVGVDLDAAASRAARRGGGGRMYCHPCLDWSERRPHLGGAVGAALCAACFRLGWARRPEGGGRAVAVTLAGRIGFRRAFGMEVRPVG